MSYQILLDNNVLKIALKGRVTGDDLHAVLHLTTSYERTPMVPHRITDMSGITELGIGFPDILALAQIRRSLRFPNAFKSAIIASQSEHFGYARMFQTLNDNPQIAIRIFSSTKAANDWIADPGALSRQE